MHNNYQVCPYCLNTPCHNFIYNNYPGYPYPHYPQYTPNCFPQFPNECGLLLKDYGSEPFVINIEEATTQNANFRTALWTGNHLQLTLMSLRVGEDIGLEMHPDVDQFIRIERGQGLVQMGNSRNNLDFQRRVYDDYVILIPAGKWHNLINTGNQPLKLYSIYAPPEHPHGTIHKTKADALAAEEHHDYR